MQFALHLKKKMHRKVFFLMFGYLLHQRFSTKNREIMSASLTPDLPDRSYGKIVLVLSKTSFLQACDRVRNIAPEHRYT